jgi:hypothetical protein
MRTSQRHKVVNLCAQVVVPQFLQMLQKVTWGLDYQSAGETDNVVCRESIVHKQRSQAMRSYCSWPGSLWTNSTSYETDLCNSRIGEKSEQETCLKEEDQLTGGPPGHHSMTARAIMLPCKHESTLQSIAQTIWYSRQFSHVLKILPPPFIIDGQKNCHKQVPEKDQQCYIHLAVLVFLWPKREKKKTNVSSQNLGFQISVQVVCT